MKTGKCPPHLGMSVLDTRIRLLGLAVALVAPVVDARMDATYLLAMAEEAAKRIRGNRSSDAPVTWDDLRRIMVADMRIVIEYLEGSTNDGTM